MELKPLRRTSLYLAIVEQLESYIMSEQLQPGDRLPPERDLAETLGVSRTTVRQALAVLEAKGLIESHIGSGTYARRRSPEFAVARLAHLLDHARVRLTEALEVRSLLEPEVARLAAERGSDDEIRQLTELAEQMSAKQGDLDSWLAQDSAFHQAVARAAKNRIVLTILEVIHNAIGETRRLSLSAPEGVSISTADHLAIAQAIAARDGKAAQAAMAAHMENVRRLAAAQLEKTARDE
ncbi:MAG: FadR family transcriptional regulator [Hydrogenibacillus sp.]|nr:FadR family transcriptional regulator [Hydrogenibacillus sp.]